MNNTIITGKAGSGKTTLAKEIKSSCLYYGTMCVILDGDDIRKDFDNGYSDESKLEHIIRIGKFANILNRQGYTVIIAAILPKIEWRNKLREIIKNKTDLLYIPGGKMWKGTVYEKPIKGEDYEIYEWRK